MIFRRSRFSDVIARQLDVFRRGRARLLEEVREAKAKYDRAERDEAEEVYGDYVDVVEAATEALAEMRWRYIATLDESSAEEYEAAFNRAVQKRWPPPGSRSTTADGAHRGLRADRRSAVCGARRARRLDRLALLPALRLRLLRRAARHAGKRPLVTRPRRRRRAQRRYLHDTMVLETTWKSDEGTVRVFDFMPPRGMAPDVVRVVEGVRGSVRMRSELVIRFDYGHVVPGCVARVTRGSPSQARMRCASARPRTHRREHADDLGVRDRGGPARSVQPDVVPVAPGSANASTRRSRSPRRRASGVSGTRSARSISNRNGVTCCTARSWC